MMAVVLGVVFAAAQLRAMDRKRREQNTMELINSILRGGALRALRSRAPAAR